jgi:hypothetical protein
MMIPLYSLFTPSHRVLKENYFMPTLPPDVDLHLRFVESEGAGFIQDESWRRAIIWKVELILEAIERHWNDVFAYSDVDAQFFGSFAEWFHRALARHDLVFQPDAPGPALCAGFFFCRANVATRALWQQVLQQVHATEAREDDQSVARRLVRQMPALRHACLPPIFYGGGTMTGRLWNPGDKLLLPRGLLVHHANFTLGVGNKIHQLDHVRELVQNDDFIPLAEACERVGVKAEFEKLNLAA